ncbi:PREDICTED: ABI gene family member 3 [Corvus brachyrhynchos]|uniref:ABI gene family member 3 n=1 Tax=Corvus brachyrhynchos TaxID=85066 RepID=UPI000816596C|nr:PREDICTED: ABI gene family member 3 [Corvus brachyrhynchos]
MALAPPGPRAQEGPGPSVGVLLRKATGVGDRAREAPRRHLGLEEKEEERVEGLSKHRGTEPAGRSELEQLRQRDIPEGQQLLRDQHDNLHRVAEYCHSNYLQASDKRKALEETMALSTQSLASVTYQVSSLATAFLRLLDLQAAQLRQVEADVACVAQRVDIHKEKVSRREIGSLTISKRFPTYQKIVAPPNPPVLEPYYRKPLNFSVLDDIGHGIKVRPGQEGVPQWAWVGFFSPQCPQRCPEGCTGVSDLSSMENWGPCPAAHSALGALHPTDPFPLQKTPTGGVLEALQPHGAFPTLKGAHGRVFWRPLSPTEPSPIRKTPTEPSPLWKTPTKGFFGGLSAPQNLPHSGRHPQEGSEAPAARGEVVARRPPAVPPPPPLPEDLLPPPPGDLAVPPPDLLPPAPDDLELLPPPSAVPDFEDLALPPPPAAEDPPWAPENYLEKVVALYPYTRQKDNELSFEPGTLLFVTRRYSDGWCEGVMGQEEGFFPGNYVEPF